MIKLSPATRLAGPADTATHGEYRIPDTPGPLLRFTARITDDGEFTARPFRFHVYGGWFCPWSQRVAITRALSGLDDIVTMSFVDGARDGRGWAFRERYGPDPVNGFTLLREVYEASEEGFDGHVSVPALWDRANARLVSNDCHGIGIGLATRFRHLATPLVETYPSRHREAIEELNRWLGPAVNHGAAAAARSTDARSADARESLLDAFEQLDGRLSRSQYLLGEDLTDADIRLWVTLVRYDVGPNAGRTINPGLHVYPHLWSYARELYRIPAFNDTTDFAAFARPGAIRPDWDSPTGR